MLNRVTLSYQKESRELSVYRLSFSQDKSKTSNRLSVQNAIRLHNPISRLHSSVTSISLYIYILNDLWCTKNTLSYPYHDYTVVLNVGHWTMLSVMVLLWPSLSDLIWIWSVHAASYKCGVSYYRSYIEWNNGSQQSFGRLARMDDV